MNLRALKERYHKQLTIIDGIWGALSLFIMFAMVGVVCFWMGQPQFFYSITNSSLKPHIVSTEGDVFHPNILISGVGKAEYTQWIENRHGDIIHTYAKVLLDVGNGTHIQQQRITIPRLPKGLYVIKGEMMIKPNPLKHMKVDITLGIIDVRGMEQREADIERVHQLIPSHKPFVSTNE